MNTVTRCSRWFCHQQRRCDSNAHACVTCPSQPHRMEVTAERPGRRGTGREVSLGMVPGWGGGQRVDGLEGGLDRTPTSLGFKIYCMGQRERQTEREGEELGLQRSPDEGGIKDLGSHPKAGCLCSFGFSHNGVEQSWLGKNRSLRKAAPDTVRHMGRCVQGVSGAERGSNPTALHFSLLGDVSPHHFLTCSTGVETHACQTCSYSDV